MLLRTRSVAAPLVALVFVAALVAVTTRAASAHEAGTTAIEIDRSGDETTIVVDVPVDVLGAVLGFEVADDPVLLSLQRDAVTDYLSDHLTIEDDDGGVWGLLFTTLRRVTVSDSDLLRIDATAVASGSDSFTVSYDGIVDVDESHRSILTVTDDGGTRIAGIFTDTTSSVAVGHGLSDGFVALVEAGFAHVLEGADHVLFLVALLVPAPLVWQGRRWRDRSTGGTALRRVIHLATAFTLGHSLTLAASALGWVSAPTAPVEVLIGVSVAVSALHALVPLARRGEAWIAAGFGLVHGLAFAGILADLGLDGGVSVLALLGFNLGVELAQLVIVAATFPSLWLLAGTPWYDRFRAVAAGGVGIVALGWVVDRTGLAGTPFTPIETWSIEHLPQLALGLAATAGICRLVDRRSQLGQARPRIARYRPMSELVESS